MCPANRPHPSVGALQVAPAASPRPAPHKNKRGAMSHRSSYFAKPRKNYFSIICTFRWLYVISTPYFSKQVRMFSISG